MESILGPEDHEADWFKSWDDGSVGSGVQTPGSPLTSTSPTLTDSANGSDGDGADKENKRAGDGVATVVPVAAKARGMLPVKVVAVEKEKERLLNATGDICGGRGGELGRRLEAWLCVNGDADGRVELARRWAGDVEDGAPLE